MADLDFDAFALVPKGHAFEDFHEGQFFEHHWGRTLNEGDNSLFATVVLRLETGVSCLGSVGYGSFTSTRPPIPAIQRRHKHQGRARRRGGRRASGLLLYEVGSRGGVRSCREFRN